MSAKYTTAAEIRDRGGIQKNERTIESCHLHFNGPGAAGFGVKRTAMLLPESVMLLAAPSCCGRHGTITGKKMGFDDRMFYLQITERDMVTGKYLSRIPQAAKIIAEKKPKVIFLCMTCIDAMMGTDLERIARQVEEETGIKTVGSFMDPIAREGRKAPMISVQKAVYSAIEPMSRNDKAANIVGNFVPLDHNSELYSILREKGYENIRQISACETYEEYLMMGEADLNIVINPQAVAAAEDMEKRLGIPFVHLRNVFGPERIETELRKLGVRQDKEKAEAENRILDFVHDHSGLRLGIGEAVNGNDLELALTFLEAGADVRYAFKNILTEYDLGIIERIADIRPEFRILSGVHPSMISGGIEKADVIIGLDAGYFSPGSISVCWNTEKQTFGYSGINALLDEVERRLADPIPHREQMRGSYLTV